MKYAGRSSRFYLWVRDSSGVDVVVYQHEERSQVIAQGEGSWKGRRWYVIEEVTEVRHHVSFDNELGN